ncbi:ATP synthase subunit b, mitochondrial isoform X2 [Parasteatoda tepidariorum]|uniref:ATP synthase subunit b, mitochondrial isoform X3 n=1 Tax=Parasteatoda tepidariorum TaxID=114398 RepID=UPI000A2C0031|nr:ATP synthase subunit b, mitochondrial isoform X2 [Parasteatoda tepidariorum]XP_042904092.1 ATP synthase subunit b, mitochondrial isoform X1 [Parasteatoda tepidariorum]
MIPVRSLIANKSFVNAVAVRMLGPKSFYRAESTVPTTYAEQRAHLEKLLTEELPKPYDGPERDLVNFPKRKRAIDIGKVRMGFLPDEWFTFFYKKTGVTGPYVFGTGLLTFLLSKEFYVIEDEFSTGLSIFILFYIALKKFGPSVSAFAEKCVQEEEDKFENEKKKAMDDLVQSIEGTKKGVWQMEGQKILMNSKRENVQMQLETEYRRRLMHVFEQVKRRLDYQLELVNTRRKLEQKHMVDWIVNSVVKSITPQQEKEALQKCIDDLKALAVKAH